MKNTFHILLFIFLFPAFVFAQEDDCSRNTNFGATAICLPVIDGYEECYFYPTVKLLADGTEAPINTVLGFYFNDETYSKKDSLEFINFDDYFKVYATLELQDYEVNRKYLQETMKLLEGNFMNENWNLVEDQIDEMNLNMKIGTPVIVKSYNYNEDSFTLIILTKYEVPNRAPYTMVMSINGLLIENRIIWMAYYLDYNGEKSIKKVEEQSSKILGQLFETNK